MAPRQHLHGDNKLLIVAASAVAAATVALLSTYAYSYFQRRRSCRAIMEQVSSLEDECRACCIESCLQTLPRY